MRFPSLLWWRKKQAPPPPPPFEDRVLQVTTQLKSLVGRLKLRTDGMNMKSREVFELCVRAHQERDEQRAVAYANELAEARKFQSSALRNQFSLESVILRLETIKDFSEIEKALVPAGAILNHVRGDLRGIVPEVADGLNGVEQRLADIMVEFGTVPGSSLALTTKDEEAAKILREAAEVAAQRTRSSLPEVQGGSRGASPMDDRY
ncbi:MAG: hypothetical protein OEY99_04650 [Aigarchaeota archaeon]|nr:hypothetical protein [Aigarchaeota archaeon]MDH5703483.1 hypothetical protein [Aigarchaeota archaeon]